MNNADITIISAHKHINTAFDVFDVPPVPKIKTFLFLANAFSMLFM